MSRHSMKTGHVICCRSYLTVARNQFRCKSCVFSKQTVGWIRNVIWSSNYVSSHLDVLERLELRTERKFRSSVLEQSDFWWIGIHFLYPCTIIDQVFWRMVHSSEFKIFNNGMFKLFGFSFEVWRIVKNFRICKPTYCIAVSPIRHLILR